MKPTTLEWIDKAKGDWHVAQMSYRARKHPNYDAAAFHAQQCAEKYLKAALAEAGITFHETHDLLVLHNLALSVEPAWSILQPFLLILNPFTVAYRYPGSAATQPDAKDALQNCREVRAAVRLYFSLPL
jgi:HEPN domain-containing protein